MEAENPAGAPYTLHQGAITKPCGHLIPCGSPPLTLTDCLGSLWPPPSLTLTQRLGACGLTPTPAP